MLLGDDPDMDTEPIAAWVRCSAADLYFTKDAKVPVQLHVAYGIVFFTLLNGKYMN